MILGPNILEFTEKHFTVPDGQHKGEPLLLKDVPWFTKPLLKIEDDEVKVVTIYKATGGGGTTIGEIGCGHRLIKRPNNILWNTHIDKKVKKAATRLFDDQLDNIDFIQRRYRHSRYDKDLIAERRLSMPQCTVTVQAANESNAQSDRVDTIFNDELWKYGAGIYEQFIQRTTGDFPFAKIVNLTSAATEPEQAAALAFNEGDQDEFHLRCRCGKLVLLVPGRESRRRYGGEHILQWDTEGTPEHQASTVRMVCPYCGKETKNTPKNRRQLLEGADYVRGNHENSKEIYSCRFNSYVPWFEPWEKSILKWIKANISAKYGSMDALKDVYVKSLAITFDGRAEANESPLYKSECYDLVASNNPIGDGKLWIAPEDDFDEQHRYMGVDYQRSGEFWVFVIQTDPIGNQRMIWAGRCPKDFGILEKLRQFFEVVPGRVGLDAGTDAHEANLYENCAILGYTALNAEKRIFTIAEEREDPETGEIEEIRVRYPFSSPSFVGEYYKSNDDDAGPFSCQLVLWDKDWISDQFNRIRIGKAYTKLLLPANLHEIDKDWKNNERVEKQLSSMVYGDPRQGKGAAVLNPKKIWHKRTQNTQEHLWDCASMVLTMMHIDGYFQEVIQDKNEDIQFDEDE